jgi:hypothetical protein
MVALARVGFEAKPAWSFRRDLAAAAVLPHFRQPKQTGV